METVVKQVSKNVRLDSLNVGDYFSLRGGVYQVVRWHDGQKPTWDGRSSYSRQNSSRYLEVIVVATGWLVLKDRLDMVTKLQPKEPVEFFEA